MEVKFIEMHIYLFFSLVNDSCIQIGRTELVCTSSGGRQKVTSLFSRFRIKMIQSKNLFLMEVKLTEMPRFFFSF